MAELKQESSKGTGAMLIGNDKNFQLEFNNKILINLISE